MPLVHLKTGRLEYKFEIQGKYTIIKGDSGTGKTSLYELAELLVQNPTLVENRSDLDIGIVPNAFDGMKLSDKENRLLIIDESCAVFNRHDLATLFKESNNYFIIITRSLEIGFLPIHVDSVFRIKTSGRFHTLERVYSRFNYNPKRVPEVIIIEDKKSGYFFVKELVKQYKDNIVIEPAYGYTEKEREKHNSGNDRIPRTLKYYLEKGKSAITIIYDSAAFAMYIDKVLNLMYLYPDKDIQVIDYDSFECYLLNSPVYNKSITLADTTCFDESLEQFAEKKMSELLGVSYNKKYLNKCFRPSRCIKGCTKISDCKYKRFKYDDLLYNQFEVLSSILG